MASLLAVVGGGAPVSSRAQAIVSRRPAIVGSGLPLRPGGFGLISLQRVADGRVDVALSRSTVARLGGAISRIRGSVGLVELISPGHSAQM